MKFKIDPKIFQKFPGVRIGVLVILEMDNTKGRKEIVELLAEEQEKRQKQLTGLDLKDRPQIAPWREIYRQFGSKPREYRSSVEALLRRVRSGSRLPSINPLVDLYNYLSIKHFLPAGAEDLDKVKGDIQLTFAQGNETGTYIGAQKAETCYQGEVIYKDDLGFICRRWNWREAARTKIDPETKNAALVLEAVVAVSDQDFQKALTEAKQLVEKFLGGRVIIKTLTRDDPVLAVDYNGCKPASWRAPLPPQAGVAQPRKKPTPAGSGWDCQGNSRPPRWGRIHFATGKKAKEEKVVVKEKRIKPTAKKKKAEPFAKITDRLADQSGIAWRLQEAVWKAAKRVDQSLNIEDIHLEHPAVAEHGDYATNIALQLAKPKNGKHRHSPLELAKEVVELVQKYVRDHAKVTVAKPGFINFILTQKALIGELQKILKEKNNFGKSDILKGKKILLEHTSPNPQTTIMIGHLRNNFLGMTAARVLEALGAKVVRDCIINDRGIHICRAILGYLVFARKDCGLSVEELKDFREIDNQKIRKIAVKADWKKLIQAWSGNESDWLLPDDLHLKPDHFNLTFYVLGSRAFSLEEKVGKQARELLVSWEAEDKNVWKLWERILKDWSAQGYKETYTRIGSVHDWVWYESELYKGGKELIYQGLEKGIFRRSQGAIVSNLAQYGLPDTVLIKSDGTAVYHTFDLNLTFQKRKKFPSDLYIWDIGSEQTLYLRQLFAMCEQLGLGSLSDCFHLSYALINLRGGRKMSTREGTVIPADELLDELHKKAGEIIEKSDQELRGELTEGEKDKIAKEVSLAAAKYGMLRYSRETTIFFDIDKSLSLEGDSGPYLQYTYARARSVLQKAGAFAPPVCDRFTPRVNKEELDILRTIYKFPEAVEQAGENYAPNLICNFLFDLAQKFNLFYNLWPILKPTRNTSDGGPERSRRDSSEVRESRDFRLALTFATAQILKNGLLLLGIEPLERM